VAEGGIRVREYHEGDFILGVEETEGAAVNFLGITVSKIDLVSLILEAWSGTIGQGQS
jgi:hypothetical protein